jgi:sulfate transport system permease protein
VTTTRFSSSRAVGEPLVVRAVLILLAVAALTLLVGVPLAAVFAQAFSRGPAAWWRAVSDEDTRSAIRLSLLVTGIAVPLNVVFGVVAAHLLSRYQFRGKSVLTTLIDLPFSVSPVIAGLVFVLLFGRRGLFGAYLSAHDIHVIFAVPGMVLATTFVTFPFVAREVLPLMEAQGAREEEAGLTLGANGWQLFFRVTLPKIKWGLLYGVILCNARAMGEFGAVSVVSGHIRGRTVTLPLAVEIRYDEYDFVGAFAVASLLTLLALATLLGRKLVEGRLEKRG